MSCGHGAALCPSGAMAHPGVSEMRIKPIDRFRHPVPDKVLCLLRSRRSIRAFKNKPVEKELLEQIIGGANTGPTPHNAHRVGFVAIQDRETLNKILEIVAENNGRAVNILKNPAMLDSLLVLFRERLNAATLLPSMERIFNAIKGGDDMLQHGTPPCLCCIPGSSNDFWLRIDTVYRTSAVRLKKSIN